eukprot:748265-Hanusia_phi.AAC.2
MSSSRYVTYTQIVKFFSDGDILVHLRDGKQEENGELVKLPPSHLRAQHTLQQSPGSAMEVEEESWRRQGVTHADGCKNGEGRQVRHWRGEGGGGGGGDVWNEGKKREDWQARLCASDLNDWQGREQLIEPPCNS